MASPSAVQYTLNRLSKLGIDRIFGVPGDDAFAIDDAAELVPGLSWVACANELNAAYKACLHPRQLGAGWWEGFCECGDATTSANFYPRLQQRLRAGDTVVIETGTCMTNLNRMLLPQGVTAEGRGLWGSIGWATPACLGVVMAKTSGNTWMVTGDGSHQLTLNEIAVMGRYGVKLRIFVLNNGLFGIEDVISERGHGYDDLAAVQYHLLPEAFGCRNWLTAKVSTVAELDQVLDQIDSHDGAAYIEVMIPNEESQLLPDRTIDSGYKLRTPQPG